MKRNESARRVSFVSKRYSIARSFAKDDDAYSLHGTGAGVCSNELQCVAFAWLKSFTRGSTPREGTRCIIFYFFYANLSLCVLSVRANFGCERTKDVAAKREHTYTHTHRQFELYILDVTCFCDDIQTVVCDMEDLHVPVMV